MVTITDLAIALGRATPEAGSVTAKQWELWISDATMLINTRKQQLGITSIDEMKADYVIREAVVAHIRKPDDATQVSITVDDSSTSKTYASSTGRITILDEWWQLLGLGDTHTAFSIDMAPKQYVYDPITAFKTATDTEW